MSTAPSSLPDPCPAPADPPNLPRRNTLAAPARRDAVGTDFDGFTAAVADIHRHLLPDPAGPGGRTPSGPEPGRSRPVRRVGVPGRRAAVLRR
ncbi:hypothetical protein AB0P37_35870 [Streptomyces antimycoticus]|uniref:hypothetical protein n=1 Tax=Streptomyces antimycoticus TaxID=68175 RepID=UPI00343407D9